ncbi:hypothetical protein [Serratia sp. (in: enterobacteria)]|uniref:hypothetical protein n=1 Tax=Serratia sp. (in: enterobacteria) TaxID=616 RepID=UPI003988E123
MSNGGGPLNIQVLKWMMRSTVLLSTGCLAGLPSVEIKVAGEIEPSRCEIIAPNNGVYDFGKIRWPSRLNGPMTLPAMTQSWRVRCGSAAYLDIIPEDNRAWAGGNMGGAYFSLGRRDSQTLGKYMLGISNSRVDRVAVRSKTVGQPMSQAGISSLLPGKRTRWLIPDNVSQITRLAPAGRVFSLDITVSPQLTIPENVATEAVSLDGSVTLDFAFGI